MNLPVYIEALFFAQLSPRIKSLLMLCVCRASFLNSEMTVLILRNPAHIETKQGLGEGALWESLQEAKKAKWLASLEWNQDEQALCFQLDIPENALPLE